MRNPDRIDKILDEIKQVWEKYPDMRLGQLLLNVLQDPVLYYVEDDELTAALKDYYNIEKEGK